MKVVVLIFLLVQYCRSENVLDLAEKLSRLEYEMRNKITVLQTEMIRVMTEKEKLKRSMEILQDGNHECGLQLADYKRQMNDMENRNRLTFLDRISFLFWSSVCPTVFFSYLGQAILTFLERIYFGVPYVRRFVFIYGTKDTKPSWFLYMSHLFFHVGFRVDAMFVLLLCLYKKYTFCVNFYLHVLVF